MEELRAARERGGLSALEDFNVSAKPYESVLQQLCLSLCVHISKKKLANSFCLHEFAMVSTLFWKFYG